VVSFHIVYTEQQWPLFNDLTSLIKPSNLSKILKILNVREDDNDDIMHGASQKW